MRCMNIEVGMHNYMYLLTYTNMQIMRVLTGVRYLLQTKQKFGRDSYTYLLMHDSI